MIDGLKSSLDWPDHPLWHDEMDYNPLVARYLKRAYASLGRAERSTTQEDMYLSVYALARTCRGRSMSHRQLMLVHYLMGVARVKRDGDYDTGFNHFITASEVAQEIGDTVAAVKLAYLAGSAARAMLRCFDAVECHTYSLDLLRSTSLPLVGDMAVHSCEVDLLLALAGNNFALGHYAHARANVDESRSLALLIPNYTLGLQNATIDVVDALLLRWQGRAEEALNTALRASSTYECLAVSPAAKLAFDRQSAVVADIALDLAESRLADGYVRDRDAYVALARPYVERAIRLANEVQDLPGWGLAELTRIRYERVAGYAADARIAAVEGVVKIGRRLNDVALLGQAQTALGKELASLGRKEQSSTRYRKALDVLANSEVPAMGVWAHRALLMQSEMMDK